MKADLAKCAPVSTDLADTFKREACSLSGERALPCGSIVTERNGRIVSKTSFIPAGIFIA